MDIIEGAPDPGALGILVEKLFNGGLLRGKGRSDRRLGDATELGVGVRVRVWDATKGGVGAFVESYFCMRGGRLVAALYTASSVSRI